MYELCRKIRDSDCITKIDRQAGFHLMRKGMGHEKFTAFWTTFGLYKYMVMPFGLTNAQATVQRETNQR